jgi:hypothetical protein
MVISTDDDSSAIGIVNSAAANKTWDISPFGSDLVINESGLAPRIKFKSGGNIEVPSLAGTGSRMVVADAAGVMSTQAIPTGSITGSGASTYVALWNGTSSLTGHFSLAYSVGNSLRLANVISPTTLSAIGFNVESGISGTNGAKKLIGINVEPTYSTVLGSVGPLDTDAIGVNVSTNFVRDSTDVRYTSININPTINQTVTASGVTRGIRVNPTITAAPDWRSIEWNNNSGWGLYGAGTASNYLAGSLSIGTAATNKLLSVSGNVILGGTTTHPNDATNAVTLNGIVSFATGDIRVNGTNVVSASSTSWTFYSGVALTSNGITGYSSSDFNVSSGATTQAVNLRVSSSTYLKVAPTTGNILIQNGGTFIDNLTDRLQVIGSSSFTGNGVFNGKLTASNSVPATGFPTTNTIALFGSQTLNIPAATIGASGVVYAAGTSANYMRFNGNTTMNGDALFAGKVVINSLQFDTTGTVTMSNGGAGGQRALSGLQVQMQFAGTTSGTVTRGASILIQGAYPNNTTGTLTFTDYYGLRINDLLEWDTGSGLGKIAVTNKWGIYQAGINDRNYFAGNMLLNNTDDTGQILQVTGAIRVNGQRTTTSGVASGQFLSINCDGTTYKIQLLNP